MAGEADGLGDEAHPDEDRDYWEPIVRERLADFVNFLRFMQARRAEIPFGVRRYVRRAGAAVLDRGEEYAGELTRNLFEPRWTGAFAGQLNQANHVMRQELRRLCPELTGIPSPGDVGPQTERGR